MTNDTSLSETMAWDRDHDRDRVFIAFSCAEI